MSRLTLAALTVVSVFTFLLLHYIKYVFNIYL